MLAMLAEGKARGLSIAELKDALGVSLATAYRDLRCLEDAGVELERVEGEGARYRLANPGRKPNLGLDARARKALQIVRRNLTALEGTFVEEVLDGLLRSDTKTRPAPLRKAGPSADVINELARALEKGQRVRFQYQGEHDAKPCERVVEPLELRVERDQLYLLAWDVEKDVLRTFKPARASRAFLLPERAKKRDIDLAARTANSVRIWDGEPVEVAIRIHAGKARYVTEWPLHRAQRVIAELGGSVVVRAKVNGLYEASRWVLSWGANAEVLEPVELRDLVHEELRVALAQYRERGGRSSGRVSQRS
jgi:proteasome accessory factor B